VLMFVASIVVLDRALGRQSWAIDSLITRTFVSRQSSKAIQSRGQLNDIDTRACYGSATEVEIQGKWLLGSMWGAVKAGSRRARTITCIRAPTKEKSSCKSPLDLCQPQVVSL
jgi:hypothetical protein